jgi:hypothetical protein
VSGHDLLLIFANATDGHDEEFNAWYDAKHVPDVLAFDGVLSARRFELARPAGAQGAPPHRYLAVYEVDREGNAVLADMLASMQAGELELSETLDASTLNVSVWSPRD